MIQIEDRRHRAQATGRDDSIPDPCWQASAGTTTQIARPTRLRWIAYFRYSIISNLGPAKKTGDSWHVGDPRTETVPLLLRSQERLRHLAPRRHALVSTVPEQRADVETWRLHTPVVKRRRRLVAVGGWCRVGRRRSSARPVRGSRLPRHGVRIPIGRSPGVGPSSSKAHRRSAPGRLVAARSCAACRLPGPAGEIAPRGFPRLAASSSARTTYGVRGGDLSADPAVPVAVGLRNAGAGRSQRTDSPRAISSTAASPSQLGGRAKASSS